ncbi:MAG: hypothetical protein JWM93_3890 [Frankiales bacterium]|nr:hypothetical protein [Frankiales bacterium]
MSNLLVDYAELHRTATELTSVADISHETAESTGSSKQLAHAAGHPAVIHAGEDYFGRWTFGMDKLTDDAHSLAKMLESTVAAFTDVDTKLGDAAPVVGVG